MLTVQVDAGAGVAVPLPLSVQQGDPARHEEQEDAASGAGAEQEHQQLRGEPTPGVRLQAWHCLLRNLYITGLLAERWSGGTSSSGWTHSSPSCAGTARPAAPWTTPGRLTSP